MWVRTSRVVSLLAFPAGSLLAQETRRGCPPGAECVALEQSLGTSQGAVGWVARVLVAAILLLVVLAWAGRRRARTDM